MASSNHTPIYKLCQWLENDPILRTDFNEDNVKVERVLDTISYNVNQSKPVFGTYTGTGMGLTQDIYLGFSPSIVIIMAKGGTSNRARCQMASPSVDAEFVQLSGSKFTVKSDMNTSVSDYTNKNPFRYVAYR